MNLFVALASLPLRLKLALGFIAAAIFAVILAAFAVSQYNQALQPAAGVVLQVLAQERANVLTSFVDQTTTTLTGLFSDTDAQDAAAALAADTKNDAARGTLETAFRKVLNTNPIFAQLRFVSPTGNVLLAVPPTILGSSTLTDDYLQALRNTPPAQRASDVYVGSLSQMGGALLNSAAVTGKDGKANGYFVGVVDMTGSAAPAQPSINGALKVTVPSTGIIHFYLVDTSGNLYSPDFPLRARTITMMNSVISLAKTTFAQPIQYTSPLRLGLAQGYGVAIPQLRVKLIAESEQFELGGSNQSGQFILWMVGLFIAGILVMLVIGLYLENTVSGPTRRLLRLATSFTQGYAPEPIPPLQQHDEVGKLYNAVGTLTSQVRQDIESLEARVEQRTRDVEATRDIGRIISSIRDLDTLLSKVVELICTRFENIYHAQIFLADANNEYAVLRVSTGEAGKKLLERGHRLAVGSQSVIGHVMAEGQPVVALDTSTSPIHKVNELLPDTRAEMALPLKTREGIIGALDLQSKVTEAFSAADINLFQSIADSLTIAITNARLFEELSSRVEEIETLNRQLTGEAWGGYLRTRRRAQLAISTRPEDGTRISDTQRQAIDTGQVAECVVNSTVVVAVPVTLRGEVLGVVEWDIPERSYTEEARQLTRDLADRLAISADNARLFEQAQHLAEREALVNDIASRLTQQSNVAQILRTAVQEVGQALHVPQTSIRLTVTPKDEDQ